MDNYGAILASRTVLSLFFFEGLGVSVCFKLGVILSQFMDAFCVIFAIRILFLLFFSNKYSDQLVCRPECEVRNYCFLLFPAATLPCVLLSISIIEAYYINFSGFS